MNTCPNCGKMAGLHGSVLQGCMCQYSMQAMKEGKDFTISKPWVGLDNDDLVWIYSNSDKVGQAISNTEARLKEKNT